MQIFCGHLEISELYQAKPESDGLLLFLRPPTGPAMEKKLFQNRIEKIDKMILVLKWGMRLIDYHNM